MTAAAVAGTPLQLGSLLRPEHIIVPLEAMTVRGGIEVMLLRLAAVGTLHDDGNVAKLVAEAKARSIVPIGTRVALPHFRTEAVEELVLALGVAPQPLARGDTGLESDPSVLVLLLAPPGASTLYLQVVSALVRLLNNSSLATQLSAAKTPADVLGIDALRNTEVPRTLTVRDVMGHRQAVAPDSRVREAVELMIKQRVKALPVTNDKGEVLGIITEWDVMRAALPLLPDAQEEVGSSPRAVPTKLLVRDIMTRSVLCISEETTLSEAANMMVNKDVEQFPVVGEGKLKGFLSRSEIIRKLFGR